MSKKGLKCRVCPDCNGIILQSMCIRDCELVCFSCERGAHFYCDLPIVYLSYEEYNALADLYKDTRKRLAYTVGGATCAVCHSDKGNNCMYCSWK